MTTEENLPSRVAADVASSVVPGAGPLVQRFFLALQSEWSQLRSKSLKAAEVVAGMSREDLAERIEANPELVPLATRLLYEAAMSGQDAILDAMGAAFGVAASDLQKVDDCEVILGGLRNLRGTDVHILQHMRGGDTLFRREGSPAEGESRLPNETFLQATIMGVSEEAYTFALIRLVNQGFARSIAVLGGTGFEISDLGDVLCDALQILATRSSK